MLTTYLGSEPAASTNTCFLAEKYKVTTMSLKFVDDEIDTFVQMIMKGEFDGQEFVPMWDKKMFPHQMNKITRTVQSHNE